MIKKRKIKVHPYVFIILTFLSVILLGTICFMLPWAVTDGKHLSFIDALFMATSSVCVTGLSVITPAVKFSLFGKIIMAVLMKIGDKIKTDKGVEIEIVGLFSPKEIEGINDQVTTYDKIQNLIITDLATLVAYENGPAIQGFNELTVSVNDPQNMEEIISKVKEISGVDWKGFSFLVDNEDYENAASSLEQLSELVSTILMIALIVSIAILSLILTMWARTRIHETGVLLSVGISKLSILGQYIAEVLLIAILAFSLSCFSASAIAGQMGNVLQSGQAVTEAQQEDGLSAGTRGEAGTDTGEPEIETPELQVRVQLEEMGLLFLLGIGIVTVSAGISSISVMRLKPREILSKMS